MSENKHISDEDYLAFQYDMLMPAQKEEFLEHICTCDSCADRFTMIVSEELLKAPRDLKANILRATRRPEVQIEVKARETSKRMQLFLYSLKVCTATVCALLLLLFSMNIYSVSVPWNTADHISSEEEQEHINKSLTSAIRDGVDKINSSMLNFSNTIINKEVTDNDQKEE